LGTPTAPPPAVGDGWYYALNGKRLGPCAQADVAALVTAKTIRQDTMVWRKGMPGWQQASLSDLNRLFATLDAEPPPLDGEQVNNNLVWLLAVAPFVVTLFLNFLSVQMQWDKDTAVLMCWSLPWMVNVILCVIDEKVLKAAGHDTTGLNGIACFLVPVYLFMRAAKLNQNNAYAWVWIISFGVSLLIPVQYFIPAAEIGNGIPGT
jgi:hypothetical protein